MKARGGRFLIILGAGLAAMAFVVVYLVMSKGSTPQDNTASVPDAPVMKTIVVAKVDIPAYTLLDETNLGLMEMEASTVPLDAVTDPSTLYRKMNSKPVQAQHAVLANEVSAVGFSNVLVKGERAYSLPVTARNTFAGALSEGDRVDILWTQGFKVNVPYRAEDGKIKYEKDVYTSTKTILQDVKVLRVASLAAVLPVTPDASTQTDAQKAAATNAQMQQNLSNLYDYSAPYSAVLIIAVTDQQAEVMKYAQENGGQLDLTLRSSAALRNADGSPVLDAAGKEVKGDHDAEKTTGVTLDELIKSYGLTPPPTEWGPAPTP